MQVKKFMSLSGDLKGALDWESATEKLISESIVKENETLMDIAAKDAEALGMSLQEFLQKFTVQFDDPEFERKEDDVIVRCQWRFVPRKPL